MDGKDISIRGDSVGVTRNRLVGIEELEISEHDRELLRRYLLGQMAEPDLSQVEERFMSESKLYEELLILEDELIDQYVRGLMSQADRANFETYFLQSQEHRQKVRFARALNKYVDRAASAVNPIKQTEATPAPPTLESDNADNHARPPRPRPVRFRLFSIPALNYAMTDILLMAIGGGGWLVVRNLRPANPGQIFEATLIPGGISREGGAIQTVTIPSGTDTVRLQLTLPAEQYSWYRIELIGSDGTSVLTREQLTPTDNAGKKLLRLDIRATTLRPDTYRLKLNGRSQGPYEEIASYNFRVK